MNGKDLVISFAARFKEVVGFDYLPNWGRDVRLMNQALIHGEEIVGELIERFFQDDNPYIVERGYSVPLFFAQINSYLSRRKEGSSGYGALKGGISNGDAQAQLKRGELPLLKLLEGTTSTPLRPALHQGEVSNSGQVPLRASARQVAVDDDPSP